VAGFDAALSPDWCDALGRHHLALRVTFQFLARPVLACHAAMGLGTLSGGWRIVRTVGHRITRLSPVGGFAGETAGAATLFLATQGGIPVSTTHTIAGAVAGVGSLRGFSTVRWRIAQSMGWAWLLTMPVSGLISAAIFLCAEAAKSPRMW
jgi:PiT family inorganic phosphate transporter